MRLSIYEIEYITAFLAKQPVLRAWVFGSYSRGEATPESDVDVLVELDYSQPVGLEFVQMQIDLQKLLNRPVDLVSARGLSKHIQPIIDREKQLIYAR